jgi:hypothetical protein
VSASAYLLGREPLALEEPFGGADKVFAATRLDKNVIKGASFCHCTFANISFKEVKITQVHFEDCVFVGCYFRKAELEESSFAGCRFFDCDFPRVAIRGCDFRYCKFSGCLLTFSEMRHSLPQEPNLREELAANLAVEASALGHPKEARAFRMCAIGAREENLKAAIMGQSDWYRQHYDLLRRIGALVGLLGSILNRNLWGYGEQARVLMRNFLILGLVVFPLLFYFTRNALRTASGAVLMPLDSLYFSLQNILPGSIDFGVRAVAPVGRILAGVESILGMVIAGLFVTYLFRWILRR